MAKCTDPMLAQLSGRIGNVVICRRGNTTYARVYAKPSNPDTEQQKAKRLRFKAAVDAWHQLTQAQKQELSYRAKLLGRTGYNLFVSEFLAPKPQA